MPELQQHDFKAINMGVAIPTYQTVKNTDNSNLGYFII